MTLDLWQAVAAVVMLLTGGGGVGMLLRTIPDWKKSKAEEQNLNAETAATLTGTSLELVEALRVQFTAVSDQLTRARVEGAELRDEIDSMRRKVMQMKRELDAYRKQYGPLSA